jgi:hypothetical protein
MATKGRGGDSMLVHMTPGEVQALQALAQRHGGTLTINPETGQPEANFLKKLLPAIAGAALNFFAPGVGTAVGGMFGLGAAAGTGIAVGGISALATGSLSRGLMAGMGAYGGAGLAEGLMGAGASSLTSSGAPLAENVAGSAVPPIEQVNPSNFGMSSADKMSAGFKAVTDSPAAFGNFAKNNLGAGLAAISPIMADEGVQTTTPKQDTGNIRRFSFDRFGQTYTPQGVFPAAGYTGMAQGGIVALANGGTPPTTLTDEQLFQKTGSWEAAAAARDAQNNALNQYNWAQQAASAPAPTGSAAAQYAAANNIDINQQISNWARANPNASDALIDQQMQQYGISNEDVARALGTSGGSKAMEYNVLAGNQGLAGLNQNINSWLAANPKATREEAEAAMRGVALNEADVLRATGKSLAELFAPKPIQNAPASLLPGGVSGGGNTVRNPNGTITTTPNIPGRPEGGFTGMGQVRDAYTQGGGSLGYVNDAPTSMAEFNERFNRQTGDSLAAYKYLMGKGEDGIAPVNPATQPRVGEIARPYSEAIVGIPAAAGRPNQKYIYQDGRYVENPNYTPVTYDSKGNRVVGVPKAEVIKGFDALKPAQTQANFDYVSYLKANPDVQSELDQGIANFGNKNDLAAAAYNHYTRYGKNDGREFTTTATAMPDDKTIFEWANTNNVSDAQLAERMGISVAEVARRRKKFTTPETTLTEDMSGYGGDSGPSPDGPGPGPAGGGGAAPGAGQGTAAGVGDTIATGGLVPRRMALGGLGALAKGGVAELPERSFVIPARITSELGNGSTNAGAQKLFAMEQRLLGKNAQPVNLGRYSGGGNLVRGKGDGVSDSVPATIGGRQPARIADGEVVISEKAVEKLGDGSIEAGARKLYAMMDRVQKARGKTTGKNRVAANTRADKYLPA